MTRTQDFVQPSSLSLPSAAAVAREAARVLADAGFDEQHRMREVGVLARAWLGWDHARWLAEKDAVAPAGFAEGIMAWVARRARHEPTAYILGLREFYGRPFEVTPAVLIPRSETELLIDAALEWLREAGPGLSDESSSRRILDIGTGSGCLAVTLALECPEASIVATDISEAALEVARRNAVAWGVADRVSFEPVAFAGTGGSFDLVVTNPPYVPAADRDALQPEIRDFEPATALFAGSDGLDVIRELVPKAAVALAPGGRLIMEIGFGQGGMVPNLVASSGLRWHDTRPDLAGIPRVVIADRPSPLESL
jgi:release factor glutamine methyltransferase